MLNKHYKDYFLGFSCIEYMVCSGTSDVFRIHEGATVHAEQDSNCSQDFISVEGASASCGGGGGHNRFEFF